MLRICCYIFNEFIHLIKLIMLIAKSIINADYSDSISGNSYSNDDNDCNNSNINNNITMIITIVITTRMI